jgi:hypothetical protein
MENAILKKDNQDLNSPFQCEPNKVITEVITASKLMMRPEQMSMWRSV